MRRTTSATVAATTLTSDSTASEKRLTEPVTYHAPNLSDSVTIDVAIESTAMRCDGVRFQCIG